MIRSFLPVGQGGFAIEQFRDDGKNIVFDCGTATNIGTASRKKNIEELIIKTFEPGTRIEKVFISHLHEDHVNGLPFLLRYCRVKEIYLPYLTESEQVISLILLHEMIDIDSLRLFQRLISGSSLYGLDYDTTATHVIPQQSENRNYKNIPDAVVYSGESIGLDGDGYEIRKWHFIPFTFENRLRSKEFERILDECGFDLGDRQEILSYSFWKNSVLLRKMKCAYEQVTSDFNATTMVVYSGSERDHVYQQYYKGDGCIRGCCKGCLRCEYESGCLYTGDYCAANIGEWKALRKAYNEVWGRIGLFTIPHHGSANSYNTEIARQHARYIINAGYSNKYGHPSREVLCDLIENGCEFFWVNEHIGSEIMLRVF